MKWLVLCVLLLASLMLLGTGCEGVLDVVMRFENNSQSLTVYPVWDGARGESLEPGQKTKWRKVNPGSYTLQWKNAANGKALSAIVKWEIPDKGGNYPFIYDD